MSRSSQLDSLIAVHNFPEDQINRWYWTQHEWTRSPRYFSMQISHYYIPTTAYPTQCFIRCHVWDSVVFTCFAVVAGITWTTWSSTIALGKTHATQEFVFDIKVAVDQQAINIDQHLLSFKMLKMSLLFLLPGETPDTIRFPGSLCLMLVVLATSPEKVGKVDNARWTANIRRHASHTLANARETRGETRETTREACVEGQAAQSTTVGGLSTNRHIWCASKASKCWTSTASLVEGSSQKQDGKEIPRSSDLAIYKS